MSVFVIAEIGVCHNGSLDTAMDLIDKAKSAGANAAKFQLFSGKREIEHLRLTEDQIQFLSNFCFETGIEFMCTPFYLDAVAFLDPLVKRHKIASGWLDTPLFEAAVATGKQVIASTGIGSRGAVKQRPLWLPNVDYLHCVSLYPCPDNKARLSSITQWMAGYSDHTVGTLACVAAVALGAKIIEKHFTLDKTQTGPDHSCSAEPHEFAEMVRQIRRVEEML